MRVERLQREFPVDIDWVPFELHPETPVAGARIDAPAGSRRAAVGDQLRQLAATEGLTMQRGGRASNSRLALEAGEFARDAAAGRFASYHRAIFRAYFAEGRDVGDRGEVVRLGEEAGLDAGRLEAALNARAYASRVDDWISWAHGHGIYGTPIVVFDDRFVLVGAQEYTVFADVTRRLLARKAAEGAG